MLINLNKHIENLKFFDILPFYIQESKGFVMGGIQAIFNEYQKKYPLYTRDYIVDLMLDDGIISFDIANKIKSGTSLFLLDNNISKTMNNNSINMTEIFGGNFKNSTKVMPKTNSNRKIETTRQSKNQGDCWLLSGINALNYTDMGRKAIYDAIVPDTDGSGGVTIKFKGSPLKQKNIHITAHQIEKARQRGNYSNGDDDMIAFELATEITLKEMVKQGIAKRGNSDKELKEQGYNYRSYINGGVSTSKYYQYPISELFGLKSDYINMYLFNGRNSANPIKDKNVVLKKICQNKSQTAIWCAFNCNAVNKYIHGNHAYAVKRMEYGKYAILTDPYIENKEIKLSWKDFEGLVTDINIASNNTQTIRNINNTLPQYYHKANAEFNKRFRKM